jgi:hypothetical protein
MLLFAQLFGMASMHCICETLLLLLLLLPLLPHCG